nr:hypothetical protein [uncultured Mediterranean phage uvMED]
MPFLSKKAQSAVAGSGDRPYLNPSKIPSGESVRFALLNDQPIEFYEVWAISTDGEEKKKPFRFVQDPTAEEIEAEMGDNFERRVGFDGETVEPAKMAVAAPVYNYTTARVEVLQITQKSILRELDGISQMDDYSNLLEHDFVLGKEGSGKASEYSLRPVPQKKGTEKTTKAAWDDVLEAGFDIDRMLDDGNPFIAE